MIKFFSLPFAIRNEVDLVSLHSYPVKLLFFVRHINRRFTIEYYDLASIHNPLTINLKMFF